MYTIRHRFLCKPNWYYIKYTTRVIIEKKMARVAKGQDGW